MKNRKNWTKEEAKFLVKMIRDTPGTYKERLQAAANHFNRTISSVYCKYISMTKRRMRTDTTLNANKKVSTSSENRYNVISIDIKNIKIDLANHKLIIMY